MTEEREEGEEEEEKVKSNRNGVKKGKLLRKREGEFHELPV